MSTLVGCPSTLPRSIQDTPLVEIARLKYSVTAPTSKMWRSGVLSPDVVSELSVNLTINSPPIPSETAPVEPL